MAINDNQRNGNYNRTPDTSMTFTITKNSKTIFAGKQAYPPIPKPQPRTHHLIVTPKTSTVAS